MSEPNKNILVATFTRSYRIPDGVILTDTSVVKDYVTTGDGLTIYYQDGNVDYIKAYKEYGYELPDKLETITEQEFDNKEIVKIEKLYEPVEKNIQEEIDQYYNNQEENGYHSDSESNYCQEEKEQDEEGESYWIRYRMTIIGNCNF